jgi:hypothetical protein
MTSGMQDAKGCESLVCFTYLSSWPVSAFSVVNESVSDVLVPIRQTLNNNLGLVILIFTEFYCLLEVIEQKCTQKNCAGFCQSWTWDFGIEVQHIACRPPDRSQISLPHESLTMVYIIYIFLYRFIYCRRCNCLSTFLCLILTFLWSLTGCSPSAISESCL